MTLQSLLEPISKRLESDAITQLSFGTAAVALLAIGLTAVVVDYARMLYLRSKMVISLPTSSPSSKPFSTRWKLT